MKNRASIDPRYYDAALKVLQRTLPSATSLTVSPGEYDHMLRFTLTDGPIWSTVTVHSHDGTWVGSSTFTMDAKPLAPSTGTRVHLWTSGTGNLYVDGGDDPLILESSGCTEALIHGFKAGSRSVTRSEKSRTLASIFRQASTATHSTGCILEVVPGTRPFDSSLAVTTIGDSHCIRLYLDWSFYAGQAVATRLDPDAVAAVRRFAASHAEKLTIELDDRGFKAHGWSSEVGALGHPVIHVPGADPFSQPRRTSATFKTAPALRLLQIWKKEYPGTWNLGIPVTVEVGWGIVRVAAPAEFELPLIEIATHAAEGGPKFTFDARDLLQCLAATPGNVVMRMPIGVGPETWVEFESTGQPGRRVDLLKPRIG